MRYTYFFISLLCSSQLWAMEPAEEKKIPILSRFPGATSLPDLDEGQLGFFVDEEKLLFQRPGQPKKEIIKGKKGLPEESYNAIRESFSKGDSHLPSEHQTALGLFLVKEDIQQNFTKDAHGDYLPKKHQDPQLRAILFRALKDYPFDPELNHLSAQRFPLERIIEWNQ